MGPRSARRGHSRRGAVFDAQACSQALKIECGKVTLNITRAKALAAGRSLRVGGFAAIDLETATRWRGIASMKPKAVQSAARRTSRVDDDLFNHERNFAPAACVVQHADVLEAVEGLDDLSRVSDDEGASRLLAHTSSVRHLCRVLVDAHTRLLPAEIR